MKKIISTITTALLLVISLSSFADKNLNPLKELNTKSILSTYIEATTLGTDMYNKYLLTDDFQYTNTANKESFNKNQYLKFLKETKGLKFNGLTSYDILDQSGKTCIAKAITKFDNFSRVDFITLSNTNDGWKVSKVVTTYP